MLEKTTAVVRNRVYARLSVAALMLGVVTGVGCDTQTEQVAPALLPPGSSTLEGSEVPGYEPIEDASCIEEPSEIGFFMEWQSELNGLTESPERIAVLSNTTNETLTITLSASVSGLDGRHAAKELAQIILPAGDETNVTLSFEELPLQSVSHSSLVWTSAKATWPDGREVAMSATPFYLHYSEGYEDVFMYPEAYMKEELNGGLLVPGSWRVQGRLEQDSTLVDINDLIAAEWDKLGWGNSEPPPRGGIQLANVTLSDLANLGALTPGDNAVCSQWITRFVDGGPQNGDVRNTFGEQETDAAHAHLIVARVDDEEGFWEVAMGNYEDAGPYITLVYQGYVNWTGCGSMGLDFQNHQYVGWVTSALRRPFPDGKFMRALVSDHEVTFSGSNANAVSQGMVRQFFPVVPRVAPLEPVVLPLAANAKLPHRIAHSTSIVSAYFTEFATLEVPWAVDLNNGSTYDFNVRSNAPCNAFGNNGGCASTSIASGTWETPAGSTRPGSLQFMNIQAHETGHHYQTITTRRPNALYGLPKPDNDLCGCEEVDTTITNSLHCLGSLENATAGAVEGFAHFFAMKLANQEVETNPFESACDFAYYKRTEVPGGVLEPPHFHDCTVREQWRDNHCPTPVHGTEWDWSYFYWAIHTASTGSIDMSDMWKLHMESCKPSADCAGVNMTWARLRQGAEDEFGVIDARYLALEHAGQEYGVNQDTTVVP
ncbi:MAG: hypothetical protein AAFN41_02535 [Planctomycetota bacterium]